MLKYAAELQSWCLLLFVTILGPSFNFAKEAIIQSEPYTDGYEFRLDYFESITIAEKLMQLTKKPIIFTLRNQKKMFSSLLDLQPAYLDLDYRIKNWDKLPLGKIQLICSYHNFKRTPPLEDVYHKIKDAPAHIFKIATMAQTSLDALRMMAFVKKMREKGISLTGICMGKKGKFIRILAPVFGNVINYAANEISEIPSLEQLTAKELQEIYHYRSLNPKTSIYALFGEPIEHSRSHLVHNAAFKEKGKNAVYVKISLLPRELKKAAVFMASLGFKGASITRPLKEKIMPMLHYKSDEVKHIGSTNTLVIKNGQIRGENTDGIGAIKALKSVTEINGKKILILGAGGAAKPIIFTTVKEGASVSIVNRTKKKAEGLARKFGCKGYGIEELQAVCQKGYDILINCTSVGMLNEDETPIPAEYIIPHTIVMDIVTTPKETKLLKEAKEKQCTIVYGDQMFIEQAIVQQFLWV